MKKNLFVVYDCVSKEFGEVLSFNNEDEAKRAFIHTVFITPKPFRNDLKFYEIGVLDVGHDMPFINVCGTKLICSSNDDDVIEAVTKKTREQVEQNTTYAQIQAKIQEKLNSKFFDNLALVSNYLHSIDDSYSSKSFLKAMKKAMKDSKRSK